MLKRVDWAEAVVAQHCKGAEQEQHEYCRFRMDHECYLVVILSVWIAGQAEGMQCVGREVLGKALANEDVEKHTVRGIA